MQKDAYGMISQQSTWRRAFWAAGSVAYAGMVLLAVEGCGKKQIQAPVLPPIEVAKQRDMPSGVKVPTVLFKDITAEAGIHFSHCNGSFGKKLLPETMGGGVAFIDYDNDGLPDLLFVNSCCWPGYEHPGDKPALSLYHNKGNGKFEDVTDALGLRVTLYGMGVAVGDIDNDGWPDVFVSGVGGNRLFRNISDGHGGRKFQDVTEIAGVRGANLWPTTTAADFLAQRAPISFPSSATFLDYDGDGLLDLFVCHYVTWSPGLDIAQPFVIDGVGRAFGPPTAFEGNQCTLYRNLGGGRFEDVSAKAGVQVFEPEGVGPSARQRSISKSLGVFACDFDGDGWPDIVVANDTVRNFFFHNKGDGTFEEVGLLLGVAYAEGKARGAMGVDGCQYRSGRFAIVLANFADEPMTFLRLDTTDKKKLLFADAAVAEGIAGPSRNPLKFGTFFFDYDLDGRPDLLLCNGHLEPEISKVQTSQSYAQAPELFWNCGGKASFVPVTEEQAGPDFFKPMVGRGCAYADIDGDGFLDVVLAANGGPARLLRNQGGTGNNWIRLLLEGDGVRSNRSAIGAKVTVKTSEGVQVQHVAGARGYLSQSEFPLTFGLGKTAKIESVTVQWPGRKGGQEVWTNLEIKKTNKLQQGMGHGQAVASK
jgi:hypothetical protein